MELRYACLVSRLQFRPWLASPFDCSARPFCRLTACVSGWRAGWDNAREQEKPEARKMLVNRAESRQSTARFVRRLLN